MNLLSRVHRLALLGLEATSTGPAACPMCSNTAPLGHDPRCPAATVQTYFRRIAGLIESEVIAEATDILGPKE